MILCVNFSDEKQKSNSSLLRSLSLFLFFILIVESFNRIGRMNRREIVNYDDSDGEWEEIEFYFWNERLALVTFDRE